MSSHTEMMRETWPNLFGIRSETKRKPAGTLQPASYVLNQSFVGGALDVSGLSFRIKSCFGLVNHPDHFVQCIQTSSPLLDDCSSVR
jgi:hypothetical protein